ncbi:MAG: AAA family ATPase, partial [Clostridia bacterium]|nr:AAA family ATPase [Clostridia bacterium]
LLDEIDKLGADHRGSTSAALLEVLDSEQNFSFRDHYIELETDLSDVLFITTANSLDTIDGPLLDRMEVIELSGYTDREKLSIAKEYIIPKQIKEHGLKKSNIKITDGAILEIINSYTRESGVRELERKIGEVMRKTARAVVSENKKSVSVSDKSIEKFLGNKIFRDAENVKADEVGVCTGLAWTMYGGDTLCIEVNIMEGSGALELTGQLGDVMKESAKAAISFIRANGASYGVNSEFYKKYDIHIHVPEGAVPKDGPSAGITMATALISALTGKKISKKVAMTGEITITGRILAIGGLKEKSLAAYRAGIKTILIPSDNVKDIEEIPSEVREKINFVVADCMDTVLRTALVQA